MPPTSRDSAQFSLLALPGPCLLAVLQCCAADDLRSLFNAARAHSKLHQAAALALSGVKLAVRPQQQADSVLLYLDRHGSHVSSLELRVPQHSGLTLRQLSPTLQLHSLELSGWEVQLQPGEGFQGVLGGAAAAAGPLPLKQLRLDFCTLLDGAEGLAAALLQLPALEHLSLWCNTSAGVLDDYLRFPTAVLQQMQQLTRLELVAVTLRGPDEATPALQSLQALTRLVDLQVMCCYFKISVTASMLSGMCHLTRLTLKDVGFEPDALAGKAKLQHVELEGCRVLPSTAAWMAELLSQLQHHTQLTHLGLMTYGRGDVEGQRVPPAAACAALTASSKLQLLSIRDCRLPANVWQHLFPAGKQLLHLTSLDISFLRQLPDGAASVGQYRLAAPEGSRVVSCCPSLQSLTMSSLQFSTQQLTQLQGLSRLHTLRLSTGPGRADTGETLQAVGQLTGLRKLGLYVDEAPMQLLITQLQQLRRLPHLTALYYGSEGLREVDLKQEVSCTLF
jgi:hypothetical protein